MVVLPVLPLLCAVFTLSLATELNVVEEPLQWAECQSGWTRHGNRCFKFFSQKTTWSEAEGICVKNGGHLASIHNIPEARFVGRLSEGKSWTWLGGGGDAKGFTWYWTDSSAFDYSNWRQWEPNNYNGNEHCISVNFNESGVWNDLPCHNRLPFVCAM